MPLPTFMQYSASAKSFKSLGSFLSSSSSSTENEISSRPSQYLFDHCLDLKFTEDLLSLRKGIDAFNIRRMDTDSNLFHLSTSFSAHHNKKVLRDVKTKAPIYTMKVLHFHHIAHKIQIVNASTKEIAFTIKRAETDNNTIHIWNGPIARGQPEMIVEGQLEKRRFRVWNTNNDLFHLVAVVKKKKRRFCNVMSGRDSVMITVERESDSALVVMLVALVSEHWSTTL